MSSLKGGIPEADARYTRVRSVRARLIVLTIGLLLGLFGLYSSGVLGGLSQTTGLQWDEQMRGDWVSESTPDASGIEIYRIHVTDKTGRQLTRSQRDFPAGDTLAAAFHFRCLRAGRFDARVEVIDPTGKVLARGEKRGIPNRGIQFSEFHGIVIPVKLPDQAIAKATIRLQVVGDQGDIAFWSTTFALTKRS